MNRISTHLAALRAALLALILLSRMALGAHAADSQPIKGRAVVPGYTWRFPHDHGMHPEFDTEWWYYTGQLFAAAPLEVRSLASKDSNLFSRTPLYGFQLTFFRRRVQNERIGSGFDQSFLAHAALTDLQNSKFAYAERSASGGIGVAGAQTDDLDVWNTDWSARRLTRGAHELQFSVGGKKIELRLIPTLPPSLHGAAGFSAKGMAREPSNGASYYYSLTSMRAEGSVKAAYISAPGDAQVTELKSVNPSALKQELIGLAWMDHEFMSSTLQANQIGWDWMSLIFKDGRAVMLFQIRAAGGAVPFLSGTLIDAGGSIHALSGHQIQLVAGRVWKSPSSGAGYPVKWRVSIPDYQIDEEIEARLDSQELFFPKQRAALFSSAQPTSGGPGSQTSIFQGAYWEGALKSKSGAVIGYLEMTGYDQPTGRLF